VTTLDVGISTSINSRALAEALLHPESRITHLDTTIPDIDEHPELKNAIMNGGKLTHLTYH
jgi:hypothetical protein